MLVDATGKFITQRQYPQLCHFLPAIKNSTITIKHRIHQQFEIDLPINNESFELSNVQVWNYEASGLLVNKAYDKMISDIVGIECHLVQMPLNWQRMVDSKYANRNEKTAFTDGFPLLMISEASLNLLNSKLIESLSMACFRPNLVIIGGDAHIEDRMNEFSIGNSRFKAVKPCSRCVVTTVDPLTGNKGLEPLQTLNSYRLIDGKIMFGMNVLHLSGNTIKVGDELAHN